MTYKIVRYRRGSSQRVIKKGLTLQEAKTHCRKSTTHGDGWFDGFRKETAKPRAYKKKRGR